MEAIPSMREGTIHRSCPSFRLVIPNPSSPVTIPVLCMRLEAFRSNVSAAADFHRVPPGVCKRLVVSLSLLRRCELLHPSSRLDVASLFMIRRRTEEVFQAPARFANTKEPKTANPKGIHLKPFHPCDGIGRVADYVFKSSGGCPAWIDPVGRTWIFGGGGGRGFGWASRFATGGCCLLSLINGSFSWSTTDRCAASPVSGSAALSGLAVAGVSIAIPYLRFARTGR